MTNFKRNLEKLKKSPFSDYKSFGPVESLINN